MLQSLGLMEDCRTWASAGDAWELTTKIVTAKLCWVTRRFPSSRTGMRWPIPGLQSSAACGLEISMDVNVEKGEENEVQRLLSFVKVVPEINGIHRDSSSVPQYGGFIGHKDGPTRIDGLQWEMFFGSYI